jgi:type II secretory pathway pseudopilin PulG
MKAQVGFTLVEILAGGVISTILAGAMLSLFYLVTGNIKENAANARLLRIQTVAEDQLRRTGRKAYGAKRPAETDLITTLANNDGNAYTNLKEIGLFEDPDALIGAYKISQNGSRDTLLEWSFATGSYIPMIIGSDTVWLDGPNSSFSIFPNRRGIAFDLRYRIQENGNMYSAASLRDSVLCRGNL